MSEPLRVGIIGCGVIAPTHVESYQRLKSVDVAWACDLLDDRANGLAQRYDIPSTTSDYQQVLADDSVDLISVCTDHASHAQIVIDAFEAGKHVVCEKALAANIQGLQRMKHAHAQHPDLVFSGIFQHRFDGVNRLLKKLIEDGAFGTLLTVSISARCLRTRQYYQSDKWRGTWDLEGGGVLINQAIHYVDVLGWITGGVEALCAAYANRTHSKVIETEDTLTASLRFRNGALGTIEATSSSHLDWEMTVSVHGSEGSVEIRNGKPLKLTFEDEAIGKKVAEALAVANDPEGTDAGKSYYGTGHTAQIADVVDAVRQKRPPFVTGESAGHAVRIVLGAYESSNTGRWINLPDPIDQPTDSNAGAVAR